MRCEVTSIRVKGGRTGRLVLYDGWMEGWLVSRSFDKLMDRWMDGFVDGYKRTLGSTLFHLSFFDFHPWSPFQDLSRVRSPSIHWRSFYKVIQFIQISSNWSIQNLFSPRQQVKMVLLKSFTHILTLGFMLAISTMACRAMRHGRYRSNLRLCNCIKIWST